MAAPAGAAPALPDPDSEAALIVADDDPHAATPIRWVREGADAPLPPSAALAGFKGQAGRMHLAVDAEGGPAALAGVGSAEPSAAALWAAARALPAKLPPGDWRLEPHAALADVDAAIAWGLGARAYTAFKSKREPRARLLTGAAAADEAARVVSAATLARDMVDAPPNAMGPAQIEAAVRAVAAARGASVEVLSGEALERDAPAVHAVGVAAAPGREPRLIELTWEGAAEGPRVVIVGKGVAFDTGGLDIKPAAGMRLMKKDMGGAAHALALAQLVMDRRLPIRLTLLIPAVENAIGPEAMRPGDVLNTRAGHTVEVGNTDAEGRLILADALTRAGELEPDLTIDLATLTGAARIALGPQVIPFYTADDDLAAGLAEAGQAVHDPLWRMPLWAGYEDALKSDVADLKNDPDGWAQAGSVTAALFLQRFAPEAGSWVHFDIFAWNPRGRPGWPVGAEFQAVRALDHLLQRRYGAA